MKNRLIPTLIAIAFAGIGIWTARAESPSTGHDTALARNLYTFNALVKELERTYVDTIRVDEAFKAAVDAMLNTVDPYTEYYPAGDKENLIRMTTGSYGGIGAFVVERNGDTYISDPIFGSPSRLAGMKAGDRILRVDTVDVRGKRSDFTTRLLKGQPGTTVNVTVERPYAGPDSILTFEIERARVQEPSVPYYGVVDGHTGYVRLTSFIESSADSVRSALESFRANPDVTGVVLDLRSNGGGLVESAVEILGFFLPKGTEVMRTRGRDASAVRTYKTTHSPILPDMPLAVLIDGASASASEITAGALQDLDRAVLVGSRSFGKGLVQGTLQLPGDALLKITTAKYYIPSGRLIQALDYSHRNPDGTVARTPDSLTNEYHMRAGRIVRDGGGLSPDSVVKLPEYSQLLYSLMMGHQIFDFATRYVAGHPEIPAPGQFRITDEIYADFVAGVDTAAVKSDKLGVRMVSDLRETARREGFMTDSLSAALDNLLPLVASDLKRDLYNKREEITPFLGEEIVGRYYSTPGQTEYMLADDDELRAAISIISNPALYRRFLSAPAVE